jgi:predicted DCC family thiol-disulfide oxidoreductase YuxK
MAVSLDVPFWGRRSPDTILEERDRPCVAGLMDPAALGAYPGNDMRDTDSRQSRTAETGGERSVILFDGECAFCNRWAAFVAARDPRNRFEFLGLASDEGKRILDGHGIDTEAADTVVLVEGGRAFTRSTAALRIARGLHAPWPLFYGLTVIPRPLRDAVYRWIASRRHRFGKGDRYILF